MHYKKEYSDVLKEVESTINGISEEEAKNRLQKNAPNELKEANKVPIWKMFLESFKDPLVIILLIAAIVQIFLGEFVESIIIFVVVILNSVLGVTQTRKAESSEAGHCSSWQEGTSLLSWGNEDNRASHQQPPQNLFPPVFPHRPK